MEGLSSCIKIPSSDCISIDSASSHDNFPLNLCSLSEWEKKQFSPIGIPAVALLSPASNLAKIHALKGTQRSIFS